MFIFVYNKWSMKLTVILLKYHIIHINTVYIMTADISTQEIIDRINGLGENGMKILNKYCSEHPYHVPRETARGTINYLRKYNDDENSLYYNRFNEFISALSL